MSTIFRFGSCLILRFLGEKLSLIMIVKVSLAVLYLHPRIAESVCPTVQHKSYDASEGVPEKIHSLIWKFPCFKTVEISFALVVRNFSLGKLSPTSSTYVLVSMIFEASG